MPLFEYLCEKCGHRFEVLARSADQEKECPKCGAKKPVKQFSAFAVGAGSAGASPCEGGANMMGCGRCSEGGCGFGGGGFDD